MDDHIQLIEEAITLLHRFLGYAAAKQDFKPILQFIGNTPKPAQENKNPSDVPTSDGAEREFVEFTEKEIKQMPKIFKTLIVIKKRRCRIRRRKSGENSETYEIRFRADGYNVTACGKTRELAKANFLKKLQKTKPEEHDHDPIGGVPNTFSAFARFYFEQFRRKKVTAVTLEKDVHRLEKHLIPHFGELPIAKITPTTCSMLLERLSNEGKGKTVDELYSLLNVIFKGAIAHGIITRNPLELVFHVEHTRKSGVALSREEENALFAALTEPEYIVAAAIALYTGLRPNELSSARIDGEFIVAINSKRKTRDIEYKKIPIINRLRPYVANGFPTLPPVKLLRRRVKAALPNHILYDLRTTFYTRCDEYGVSPPARDHFVGHSAGTLTNAYRDLSDEYLLLEGKKLNQW
ncbi:MAG: hypothetical protein IJB97_05445 [Clostridia bacterium]|nr:hypothetical protein [Clostridia bacterium]